MTHFYNEIEPYPAQWLRNLADADAIDGPVTVDERSIVDLTAADVADATQVHLFAGIGGWSHALTLAGWPADRPVWTGSCPCQPFSNAGKGRGTDDARHLWPEMCRLIRECRPPIVFGEQVASRAGREWLAGVRADMEELGYAVGAADLCAAGEGAPHIRQRLYWGAVRLADTDNTRPQGRQLLPQRGDERAAGAGSVDGWAAAEWLECLDGKTRRIPAEPRVFEMVDGLSRRLVLGRAHENSIETEIMKIANATKTDPSEMLRNLWDEVREKAESEWAAGGSKYVSEAAVLLSFMRELSPQGRGFTKGMAHAGAETAQEPLRGVQPPPNEPPAIACSSHQWRLAGQSTGEPSNALRQLSQVLAHAAKAYWGETDAASAFRTFPLAQRTPGRVGQLRAYGNAIVPQVAAQFITSFMEAAT